MLNPWVPGDQRWVQQSSKDNCYPHLLQSDDAILYGVELGACLLRIHKRNQNLPLLSPGIQGFVEHEFVAYVQQLERYVDTQDVDTQAR